MMSRALVLLILVCLGAREARSKTEARPLCPPEAQSLCQPCLGTKSQYCYEVDGQRLLIKLTGSSFELKCVGNVSLESRAMPRFKSALLVNTVKLINCSPPAVAYKTVFATLNINDTTHDLVLSDLPSEPQLRAEHFVGLQNLVKLTLIGNRIRPPKLAPNILEEMYSLQSLFVYACELPPEALEILPASLSLLKLIDTGVKSITAKVFTRLRHLKDLIIRDSNFVEVDVCKAPILQTFMLNAPNATVISEALPLKLEKLTLTQSYEQKPWTDCTALNELYVDSTETEALPARWVALCVNLTKLTVKDARKLVRLPQDLLKDARELTFLHITSTKLKQLPKDLLDDTPNLTHIDFSDNNLQYLPSYLFWKTRLLQTLNLSGNQFTKSVFNALQSVTSLQTLSLAGNKNVTDLCRNNSKLPSDSSPLKLLTKLTSLSLSGTGITSVCSDWRLNMRHLQMLDLSNTKINFLTYNDLRYSRDISNAMVDLRGANIVSVLYSIHDYNATLDPEMPPSQAKVLFNSRLNCDCKLYWTARAIREQPGHVQVQGLRCAGNEFQNPFENPDELVCSAPALCKQLPLGCQCKKREAGTGKVPHEIVTVDCNGAKLDHLPSAPHTNSSWRLLLRNNTIHKLRAVDLPDNIHNLRELDLRYNGLKSIDREAVQALAAIPKLKVRLVGNPLDCNCTAEPLLATVRTRPDMFDLAHCENMTTLISLVPQQCVDTDWYSMGYIFAVAMCVLLLVLTVPFLIKFYLLKPDRLLWLKAILHRWGWLPPATEPDDGRRYDAFVSFSHHDSAFVSRLVKRLEGPRTQFRLCLHDRDWAPGEWIPAQIAASVRASRRTIAVVSRHFLRSKWARAEFREAHAHALRSTTPRLVVVLLEAPNTLPLDKELRAYLARNTYLLWGDRWFWDKLLLSMPPPRVNNPPAPEAVPKHVVPLLSDPKCCADERTIS